jgi:hypothetical protein
VALHNGPQDSEKLFRHLKESLNAKPISNFETVEFTEMIDQLATSSKTLLTRGIQVNSNEDILLKLDAIVLILELSIAAENLPEDDKKRESIQLLQKNTLDEIITSISNINQNERRWCNPDEFIGLNHLSYRTAHQRLLMINSLLFYYAGTLHKNEIIQNFAERFIHFPLKIEDSILDKSNKKATDRTSLPSKTEERMIECCLTNHPMYSPPNQFSAIKKSAFDTYIEPDTGLELDFPLENKITIELDGDEFHFINGKPTLEHLRKEKQLLENGWIRISVSTSMLKEYGQKMNPLITAVSYTLNSPHVHQYLEMHKKLMIQRSELRNEIKALHDRLKHNVGFVSVGEGVQLKVGRQNQRKREKEREKEPLLFSESASSINASAIKDNPLSLQLDALLELENKISVFLGQNHLDKLINSEALHKNIDETFRLYGDLEALRVHRDKLAGQIWREIRNIQSLEKDRRLNDPKKKSNNSQWKQKQDFIDSLKTKQEALDRRITDCKKRIDISEQKISKLQSTVLPSEELSHLSQEVRNVISPPAGEAEEAVHIRVDRPEQKSSSSSSGLKT